MRVALCQIDTTVGDLDGNCQRILRACERAASAGAALSVLPELALTGYPPRDLLDRGPFIDDNRRALDRLATQLPRELATLVGFVDRVPDATPALRNALALLRGGQVEQVFHKRLLPTYDVFDEARYFAPGHKPLTFELAGTRVGVTICEDAWNEIDSPLRRRYDDN